MIYFDEISLQYWFDNRTKIKAKSYFCNHNGYVYGDNMQKYDISLVFCDKNDEVLICEDNICKTYIKFVEIICNQSVIIKNNFLNSKAEKYKIFSEKDIQTLSPKTIKNTRNLKGNCSILISNTKYYVAHNLKICEYFNSLANILPEDFRKKCFIRIICSNETRNKPLKIVDELKPIEIKTHDNFKLFVNELLSMQDNNNNSTDITSTKINYLTLNEKKKSIGDLGELIVLEYEKQKLCNIGLSSLANNIEHISQTVGDNEGYDIKSFLENGKPLYIEVKSTEYNNSCGFYISQNEIDVANKMKKEGFHYQVYRVYNINADKGEAYLKIYEPPLDSNNYIMNPICWYVKEKI